MKSPTLGFNVARSQHDETIGDNHVKKAQLLSAVTVAYLINQHPSPSVTFIRREILGLEEAGASVTRFSIRRWPGDVIDPADKSEMDRTEVLLDRGIWLLWDTLVCLCIAPTRFVRSVVFCAKIGWKSDRGSLRTWVYLLEACRLKRRLSQLNIPWVHAHFGTNSAEVAMYSQMLGGPRFSFTVHGPEEFDRPELLHLREKIRHATLVVAISSFCRSQLYRWCDWADWQKIEVVRCGVSAAFIKRCPHPIGIAPTLVCVARLAEQKGLPILIDAAAMLNREGIDFKLKVMGDGDLRCRLEELIKASDMEDRVKLMGWCTEIQIQDAIINSRVLVLPSFAEGLPVVLMEALALGRPVISTRVAGISELLKDGENGWLVDAGDATALAGAMRAALATAPEKLQEMGQAGAQIVADRHVATREALRLGHCLLDRQKIST